MLSLCCRGMAYSCPTPTQILPANPAFKFNSPSNLLTFPSISIPLHYQTTINHTHSWNKEKNDVVRFRHFYTLQNPIATKFSIRASINSSQSAANNSVSDSDRGRVIIVCSAITLVLAIANRVLYKLALVPMKHYPFFLAQINTFAYVGIYFSVLHLRYKAGIVSDEMMALPKFRFVLIGFLEALGVVAGMSAGAMLPGPAIPILSQTFLLWQLTFSVIFLRRRYMRNQIAGCLLVAAGVITAVASFFSGLGNLPVAFLPLEPDRSGSDSGQMFSGIGFLWPMLMIVSSAFQAGASIIKESAFIDAATRLKGKFLDIFVVNSLGSGFQALFVFLFLPYLSNLKGIPFSQFPLYIKNGAGCFFNIGADVTAGCDGAPLLPLLFIVTNIAFNISLLNLVKLSSAVVSSLAITLSVPISICILSLPLPYLPGGVSLSPLFLLGCMILVMGLILYNIPQPFKQNSDFTVK